MFDNRVIHFSLENHVRRVEFTARSRKKYSLPDITRSSACRIAQLTYTDAVSCRVGLVFFSTYLHIRPV